MISKRYLLAVLLFGAMTIAQGQSPTQIVVQAMPAATPKALVPAAPAPVPTGQSTLKVLEEIKAANAAILTKQSATLEQLDEIEKAAEQIKVFSKRG